MGLLRIFVALGLLIWLAYRGWSVLLLAPAAAILAAGLAEEPLLAAANVSAEGSKPIVSAYLFDCADPGEVEGVL
jgi:H+/gluconate symporter-like permease